MTQSNIRILVIEDDAAIRKFLRVSLTSQGYQLFEAPTGKQGISEASLQTPDLIILDLGLPDMDGVEVTRQIREWSRTPIIVVSARGKEQDKVTALDAGADDYLTKPFSVSELMARLRVALRRRPNDTTIESAVFDIGDLHVDKTRRQVLRGGQEIHLTPNEYKLLSILIRNAGRVLTHQELLKEVWGPDSGQELHYLRVYMNQLRQKLEQDPAQPRYFITESGVGYRLRDE